MLISDPRVRLTHPPLTCALELPSPHALARGGAFGAVGRLAAGLRAVAGQEDLPLVDAAVVLGGAADGAVDAGSLRAVRAPLALERRLGVSGVRKWAHMAPHSHVAWPTIIGKHFSNTAQKGLLSLDTRYQSTHDMNT